MAGATKIRAQLRPEFLRAEYTQLLISALHKGGQLPSAVLVIVIHTRE